MRILIDAGVALGAFFLLVGFFVHGWRFPWMVVLWLVTLPRFWWRERKERG